VTLTLETRLMLHPHARFRRFEEDGVIVHQAAAEALVVNDAGARLLELADGNRSLAECVAAIASEFDAGDAAVAQDVLSFAAELVAAGVAQVVTS
jgi:hypothetical protein